MGEKRSLLYEEVKTNDSGKTGCCEPDFAVSNARRPENPLDSRSLRRGHGRPTYREKSSCCVD